MQSARCSGMARLRSALRATIEGDAGAGVVGLGEGLLSESLRNGSKGCCWKDDSRREDCSQRYRAVAVDSDFARCEAGIDVNGGPNAFCSAAD